MNNGKRFENNFFKSVPERVFCYRLRDAGGWSQGEETRFTITNVCDFIVYAKPKACLVECKSVATNSLPFGNINVSHLEKMVEYANTTDIESYFLIQYRQSKEVYSVDAQHVLDFINSGVRKSIPISYAKEKGQLIPSRLKKINYKFDLTEFLE